jgi:RNA polymerase sigma-70 factor (ECF subfamily)
MYTIALNALRHHFRRRRRKPEVELKDAHVDARATAAPNLARLDLERLLSLLPEGQRDVLVMFWLQDLSFAEIGEALGIKEGAARVRAHRAYARLRELAAVRGGEEPESAS